MLGTPAVALQRKVLRGRKAIEIRIEIRIGRGKGGGGGRKTGRNDEDLSRGPGRETEADIVKTARGGTLIDEAEAEAGPGIEIEIEIDGGAEVEAKIDEIEIATADVVEVEVEVGIGIETRMIARRQKMA